jgi:hypothetical protein
MSDPEQRRRMRGASAPLRALSDTDRRRILQQLERRLPAQPADAHPTWGDRGVEGRRGVERQVTPQRTFGSERSVATLRRLAPLVRDEEQPRVTQSLQDPIRQSSPGQRPRSEREGAAPRATRDDPVQPMPHVPFPNSYLSEGARGLADRTGEASAASSEPPPSPWPRLSLPPRQSQPERADSPTDYVRFLADHPHAAQQRIRRGQRVRADLDRWFFLGEDAALDPGRSGLERLERELDDTMLMGQVAGVGLGVLLSLRDILSSVVSLVRAAHDLPWDTVHVATREDVEDFGAALVNLLRAEIEDEAVTRALAEIAWDPLLRIGEHFERAGDLAGDGHQTQSSAEIIQGTIGILGLIAAVRGALQSVSRLPATVRRLGQLQRRMTATLERGRRVVAQSRAREFAGELLSDTRGSVDPNFSLRRTRTGTRVPRQAPSHLVEGLRRSFHDLAQRGVDVDDPYTLQHLDRLYRRLRADGTRVITARADAGELRALMRYAQQPGVERVRFLEPGRELGDRTPDIEVIRNGRPEYVEVRTLTQARRHSRIRASDAADSADSQAPVADPRVSGGSGPHPRGGLVSARDRAALWLTDQSISQKIFRGQISHGRPGRIVLHAPFAAVTEHWHSTWRAVFHEIFETRPAPTGLQAIEVTTGQGSLLVFEPPDWTGRMVTP